MTNGLIGQRFDIWHAGYEAAQAERPVCAKHKTPKRAHYYCLECRELDSLFGIVVPTESGEF